MGSARQGKRSTRGLQAGASATTPVGVAVNPSKVRRTVASLSPHSQSRERSRRGVRARDAHSELAVSSYGISRVVRARLYPSILFVPSCLVRVCSVREATRNVPAGKRDAVSPEVLWNLHHGALSPGIYFDAASASNDTRPSRCAVREIVLVLSKECLERILIVRERRLAGFSR